MYRIKHVIIVYVFCIVTRGKGGEQLNKVCPHYMVVCRTHPYTELHRQPGFNVDSTEDATNVS